MHEKITCDKCPGSEVKAVPKEKPITRSDGSIWTHYDCENGHTFDMNIPGDRSECECPNLDTTEVG